MVAALSCEERQRYNALVTTSYQSVLTDRGEALQAMFKRVHGGAAENRLNSSIAELANDTSQQVRDTATTIVPTRVRSSRRRWRPEPADLDGLTSKPWIESRHGYRSCVLEASSSRNSRLDGRSRLSGNAVG